MSTRGLYGFRKNGIDKTSYNHYDSYPEGLGKEILRFIKDYSLEEMNALCDAIEIVSNDVPPTKEVKKTYVREGISNINVSERTEDDWYCLLHETMGDLDKLYDIFEKTGGKVHMLDDSGFIKDSLFCEYAYIINLDTEKLEFYEGFQKEPQEGNRYGTECNHNGYYPCALVTEIPISEIKNTSTRKSVKIMEDALSEE